jgi:ribosomal subunit interface protein
LPSFVISLKMGGATSNDLSIRVLEIKVINSKKKTMKVQVTGIDYKIDEYTQDLIEDKVVPQLNKFVSSFNQDLKSARFTIKKRSRWGYRVKLHVTLAGEDLFAEAVEEEVVNAVMEAREEMERQIRDHMDKLRDRR